MAHGVRQGPDARTPETEGPSPASPFFTALGRIVVRFRFLVVLLWLVVTALCVHFFPSLASVSNNNNSDFLPKNSPSIQAATLAAPFEHANLPSALLLAVRDGSPLTPADSQAIARAESSIRTVVGVSLVRDQGISGDGSARKALVAVGARAFGSSGQTLVDSIRAAMISGGIPAGLHLYLTGELATAVDNQRASNHTLRNTQLLSVVLILVLLLLIFRALLAPLATLLPAALVLLLAGPIIAEFSKAGVQVSDITQIMLSVLLLGAGTDYGLFLVFRVREELRRGYTPHDAVVRSLAHVGESITFSAATVIAALLCLLLATLGFYRGLGPALAIGIAIMLLSGLTLLPALLAILGRATFWPSNVQPGNLKPGLWGRIAGSIVRRPIPTLVSGIVLFGVLALFATGYAASGFGENGSTATTSQAAKGSAALSAHFPAAQVNPTNVLFTFASPVWRHPQVFSRIAGALQAGHVFGGVNGPLDPNGTRLGTSQLVQLHRALGSATHLPFNEPPGTTVPPRVYNAYRATAQFISARGTTLQYYTTLAAGDPGQARAMQSIPQVRAVVSAAASRSGAIKSGVAGEASAAYDVSTASTNDLEHIVPVVLLAIAVLLAIVLRSLVAPLYLILSVGLSYLAAIGLGVIIFIHIGGGPGLNFILPFLMFIFLMALGEDYNILVMSRIREEVHGHTLREAVTQALSFTGSTVTAAGLILAGTFGVLAVTGSGQIQQIGFSICAGILLDTFLVRTLLIPSVVVLLGRWNWWPSHLAGERDAA